MAKFFIISLVVAGLLIGVGTYIFLDKDMLTKDASVAATSKQPNIIFIMTDDQDLASLKYMPNVQKYLVAEGKTFTHYFDNYAVCCVARTSILRGQNANNTGIKGNSAPAGGYSVFRDLGSDGEAETIGVWLQKAGYKTAFMGKYLNGYGKEYQAIIPGWDEWFGFTGQDLYDYEIIHNGVLKKFGSAPEDFKTDVLNKTVVSYIRDQANSDTPFFMHLSPTAPHLPATPAPRHEGMFAGVEIPRTAAFNEADVSDKPQFIQGMPLLTEAEIADLDRRYRMRLGSLQAVDDMVGDIVASLEAIGQLDTTYIFFTSDNGYHLGQHRMPAGKRTAYEEDIHLPLIVRGPGISPGSVDTIVGNIDLAPTFGELAGGITIPFEPDGRSFAGFLSDSYERSPLWRNGYLLGFELQDLIEADALELANSIEKNKKNGARKNTNDDEENLTGEEALLLGFAGVRSQNHVYVEYGNGNKEFYDLTLDPYQLDNIYGTADPRLVAEHRQMLTALRTCRGVSCHTAEQMPISNQ